MNVYKNHLSYIKDIKLYSKQYICCRCDRLFSQMQNLNKHQSKCDGTVKYVFSGGVYKNKLSVFEELEKMGVRVREEDKYESGLRVSISRRISMILMKRWMLMKKTLWKWKSGCHGTKCMCQYHLVQGVMWMGWRHVMCRVKILES